MNSESTSQATGGASAGCPFAPGVETVASNRRVASGCEKELSEIASRMPNKSIAADRARPVAKGACSKNLLRRFSVKTRTLPANQKGRDLDLIRKMRPRPIRIYMQDGDHDLDIYGGSWWHANMDMAAAFRWSGYDYFFLQGHDGHSGRQLGVNFPEAMRWLWRADPVQENGRRKSTRAVSSKS